MLLKKLLEYVEGVIMFRYIIKSLKSEKATSIVLLIPIVVSVFLIYFSLMISINMNNISEFRNEEIFHNYTFALWSDVKLDDVEHEKLIEYLSKYNYLERKVLNVEYKDSLVTVAGINYDNEVSKGFIDKEYDGAIINKEFADKFHLETGDSLKIKLEGKDLEIKVKEIANFAAMAGNNENIMFIPERIFEGDRYSSYFVVDVDEEDNSEFKKYIYDSYSMMNLKSSEEQLDTMKEEYNDVVTGIILLSLLSIIISSLIVYHSFYMRMFKEQKNIGQIRSFGIRDKRCFHIYLYKNYILGLIGTVIGIVLGVIAISITSQMNIIEKWNYIEISKFNVVPLAICFGIEFLSLTSIYFLVIRKIKNFSIIQNLRENQTNFRIKRFNLYKTVIGLLFFVILYIVKIDVFKFYADMNLGVRMGFASLEIVVFFAVLLKVLPDIIHYFNKLIEKVVIKYDMKSIIFPLKNFISNEQQMISTLVVFVASIIVSISIYSLFDSFSNSVKEEIGDTYNFQLQINSPYELDENQYNFIKGIEDLDYIDKGAITSIKIDGINVDLENINPKDFSKSENRDISYLKTVESESNKDVIHAVVTSKLADYMGWDVGSSHYVKLGGTNYKFQIGQVIESSSFLGEKIYISSSYLLKNYPYWQYEYRIGLKDLSSVDEVKNSIDNKFSGKLAVTDINSFKEEMIEKVVGNISVFNLICALIILVSFISVINILVLYVKEQKVVFASMLAIGCKRNMIFKSIIFEYLLVFIYAILFSIVLSPLFLKILIACMSAVTSRTIIYNFNISFCIIVYLVMFLAAAIISVISGYASMKVNVISTIKENTF